MRPALLPGIGSPADLRRLPEAALPSVAQELRAHLIETISRVGGHLAAGLGTVELAIALHYVFDTPHDPLVWDVGHQAYPHKVLTGRRGELATIRQRGGLSGFLRRDESEYDAFGAGHSSTSISAALGMAIAAERQGIPRQAVAIIGDGALTAGLAFEALDHAGATGADLLVVLNDNQMSISPNVGALAQTLARRVRGARRSWRGRPAAADGGFFEDLGFAYAGPVDGHDLDALVAALRQQRASRGPRLLHVVTRKGKGHAPAEADPVRYHGVTAAAATPAAPPARTYTQVFGEWLCAAAERDPRVVALTPAMREGSGLVAFAQRFPDRYHDVGIAEQHCVTFAAGLAASGVRPVVAIYSTFLQRAYDQLIHDVALQKLPVVFAVDRAGLVGPDGATHNGSFDLSFLRCIPNMVLMAPSDGGELVAMLDAALAHEGPAVVRYPRAGAGTSRPVPATPVEIGRAEVRRRGRRCALLAFGTLLEPALAIGEALDATVVNMRFVKPLDAALLRSLAATHELLVTLEEAAVAGGAGSAVGEWLAAEALPVGLLQLGLPDTFPEHATRDEALAEAGLGRASLERAIRARLAPALA
ncbi:MAG: 1-deoxy-D-xylulose-5-phosphate synthase [Proteobacteria bacterium]|nr:1-deoxy-D-xylulose-5-phosphate synthase [Pseudomonadota bacterium]